MANIIIILILALIIVYTAFTYKKKLQSGCCGTGEEKVKRIKRKNVDLDNYPYLLKMKVKGMHCKNCAAKIENGFNADESRISKVDLASGTLTLRAKTPIDTGAVKAEVFKLGYTAGEVLEARGA